MSFVRLLPKVAASLIISLAAPTLAACEPRESSEPSETAVWSPADDALMLAATREARASLADFWVKYEARDPSRSRYSVKIGLPTRHGGVEHIWGSVVRRSGDKTTARIDNEPEDLADVKFGDEITVDHAAISDWMYLKDGKLYGSFTTRAMLSRVSAAQRKEAMTVLAPTPLEPSVH